MKKLLLLFILLSAVLSSVFAAITFDVPLTVSISNNNNYTVTINFVNQEDAVVFHIFAANLSSGRPDHSDEMQPGVSKSFNGSNKTGHDKKLAIVLAYQDEHDGVFTYWYGEVTYLNWTKGYSATINVQGKIGGEPSDNLAYFSQSSIETINLGNSYSTPQMNATENTTAENYLGKLGSMNTGHRIQFTVSCSGKFQSASEPTLYRNFWIALAPYRMSKTMKGTVSVYNTAQYYYDVSTQSLISSTALVPNTRDSALNTVTVTTPQTFSVNSTNIPVGPGSETAYVVNQWYNLMLCMEDIDAETLKHMAEVDDYYATITISWHCIENGCDEVSHSGSYIINLRGYYSFNSGDYLDTVSFVVSPTSESMGIDLIAMAMANPEVQNPQPSVKISDFRVLSTAKTVNSSGATPSTVELYRGQGVAYNWKEHVFVYLSASSNLSGNNNGFQLVNKTSHKAIPFQVQVRDDNGVVNKTYDGTTAWNGLQGSPEPSTYCLDLGTLNITNDNRGNTYGSIDFSQSVYLVLPEAAVTMLRNYKANPNANGSGDFPGKYEAIVYYHIICTD